jgi:hypothetical protein
MKFAYGAKLLIVELYGGTTEHDVPVRGCRRREDTRTSSAVSPPRKFADDDACSVRHTHSDVTEGRQYCFSACMRGHHRSLR